VEKFLVRTGQLQFLEQTARVFQARLDAELRMQCGGTMIEMEEVDRGVEALRPVLADWDPHPTFFEVALMLALDWFDRRGAEVVVLETGMGGRLDATNALTPEVSVITPIDMDHQQWLGGTLAEIAAEKAGIIKPGVPVVSAPQPPDAERVLREAAARAGTSLTFVQQPWVGPVSLAGDHQRWNAALAVAAVEAAGFRVPMSFVAEAVAATDWPARFQQLPGGRIVIDGAHNPHGAASTVRTWRQVFGEEKATIVFGAVAAKDYAASLSLLAEVAARFLFVTLQSPRAVPGPVLAQSAPGHIESAVFETLPEALKAAENFPGRCLVCGSLYLCGEALALAGSGRYEPSAQ
jgi:dihydrofolate synthase/folylpolyglutamate synthase